MGKKRKKKNQQNKSSQPNTQAQNTPSEPGAKKPRPGIIPSQLEDIHAYWVHTLYREQKIGDFFVSAKDTEAKKHIIAPNPEDRTRAFVGPWVYTYCYKAEHLSWTLPAPKEATLEELPVCEICLRNKPL